MYEIRVHGLGGQGAVTLVTWIARIGYGLDKHVQAFPFFGAERRGAPVKAFFRIDDRPINLRSQVYNPDLLLVMDPSLVDPALEDGISPDGEILLNSGEQFAERTAARLSRDVYHIDATGIALDLGLEYDGMPMVNMPLLGATVCRAGVAHLEDVLQLVDEVAKRGNADAYENAARRGFDGVRRVGAKEKVL